MAVGGGIWQVAGGIGGRRGDGCEGGDEDGRGDGGGGGGDGVAAAAAAAAAARAAHTAVNKATKHQSDKATTKWLCRLVRLQGQSRSCLMKKQLVNTK